MLRNPAFLSGLFSAALLFLSSIPQAAAQHNYASAFQQALYWYEAQTSGAIPLDHRVEWRGDSAMRDGSDVDRDLTGGWYDAGDGVVWTGNDALGASLLAWSLYRDQDIYISTGQYQRAIDRLREINQFFDKIVDDSGVGGSIVRIYVGKGAIKHAPPDDPAVTNDRTDLTPQETMDTPVGGSPQMVRPSYWVDATTGGADVAGALSAALAASSIAFRDYGDVAKAEELLVLARKVYAWGEANPNSTTNTRRMTNGSPVTVPSYPIRSADWTPRMIYGAAWLHRAELAAATPGYTTAFVDKAQALYLSAGNSNFRNKSWISFETGGQHIGAYAMLAADTGRSDFVNETNAYADFWAYRRSNTTGLSTDITLTPGGFLARNRPSVANGGGWNVNLLLDQAPPLLDWAESPFNTNTSQRDALKALFKGQLPYILGSNPKGKSYLQGYDAPGGGSSDWFMNAHYRSTLATFGGFGEGIPASNAYPCYGLLIPGPGHTDEYPDTAISLDGNIRYKEPIIYTGGLLTVLAQKIRDDGAAAGTVPGVFPPWINRGPNYQTESFFVQAYREDGVVSNGIRFQVALNNRASLPAREINTLAFRYYYTPDGVSGSSTSATATLISGLPGESLSVHGPTQVGASSTWYFEFRFNNAYIVPGEFSRYRRRAQISISQSGGTFSLANDHSGDSVAANATYTTVGDMPVYDFSTGKLLGGFEPSAGYIQWRRAHFNNVNESASAVTLIAERVGGAVGAVSSTLLISSGTATAGADFTVPGNLTLSWAAGETGEKTLTVPLVEDPYDEGRHYFTATLGSLTGGAAAGIVSEARVSIEDNDFGGPPDPGGLVQVLGNSLVIANGDLSPSVADHTDFGAAESNYAPLEVTRTFTLKNNDASAMLLTGSPRVQISGAQAAEFTLVTPPPASIAAHGTATFQVKFAPVANGSRHATLTIPNSISPSGSYGFALRGTGVPATPTLSLDKPGVAVELSPATNTTRTLTLTNSGRTALTYNASLPAGYSGRWSSDPGGPAYQWHEPDASWQLVYAPSFTLGETTYTWELGRAKTNGGESSTALPIPFGFPFYGTTKTAVKAKMYGYLDFVVSGTSALYSNRTLPVQDGAPFYGVGEWICAWWDDLYFINGTTHTYYKQLDPDTIAVSWKDWAYLANQNARMSFQVLLKRNGTIINNYKQTAPPPYDPSSPTYTIGVNKDGTGVHGYTHAYGLISAQNGVSVEMFPPSYGPHSASGGDWCTASGTLSGTLAPGASTTITLHFNSTGLASGHSYPAQVTLTTNDPSRPVTLVPVSLSVSGLYNLASAGVANRSWETAANWSPAVSPGPADRWNLTTGGGSLDLRGDRSLGAITVNAASSLTLHGQGLGGSGSGSSLTLNGASVIQQGGLLVGGWNAGLRVNGSLTLSGGSFGFGSSSNGAVILADDSPFTLGGGTFVTASTASSVNYFTTFGTGDVLVTGAGSVLNVPIAGEQPFTRRFTGSGSWIKTGQGTLLLTGAGSNHSGLVQVDAGTLKIAGQDVLGDTALLRLNGGTLAINGYAETLGALDVEGASTIHLGGVAGELVFADSSAQAWGGTSLAITGHVPGVNSIRFGSGPSGLTSAQLAKVTVNGAPVSLNSSGYLETSLPPDWSPGWPKADTITSTGFTARAQIPEAGTAYYVVVADGSAAPSVAQVKLGQNASNSAALRAGSLALVANTEASAAITGLTSNTAYDLYFVAEDSAQNTQVAVTKVDVSTAPDSFTWAVDAAGNWNLPSNWNPAAIPNAPAITVTLGPVITASRTVTLNQDATLGTLVFNEETVAANAYHLSINSGRTLTFDVATGQGLLQARGASGYQLGFQGQGAIFLADPLAISAGAAGSATAEAGTVAISSPISGSGGLVLSTLNSNDGTGTQVSGIRGTLLRSTTANSFTGGVTVNSGYVKLAGNAGNLGSGTLTLATSNSDGGGSFGTSLQLRTGGGTVANAITFTDTPGTTGANPRVGIFAEDGAASTYTLTGPLSGSLTSETLRFGGFAPSGNGNVGSAFILRGDGSSLSLNSVTVHLRNGSLTLEHSHALGTGNGLGTGSVLAVGDISNNTNTAAFLTNGRNVAANLRVESNLNTSSGNVSIGGTHTTGSATFSGTLQLNPRSATSSRLVNLTSAPGGVTIFSGAISNGTLGGNVALPVQITGGGTVLLNGANTFTGTTTVQSGSKLGGTGSLTGPLTLAEGAQLTFHLATNSASHDRFDAGVVTFLGSSSVTISAAGSAVSTGTYLLLRGTNTLSGELPTLVLPQGYAGSLGFSGTDLQLTVTQVPFENWAEQAGLTSTAAAENADPDNDGLNNLLEYALGGSPNSAASAPLPSQGTSGNFLTLTFARARSDVDYVVEGSNDLVSWTELTTNPGAVGETLEVVDSVDLSTANPPRRFLRLRVLRD